MQSQIIRDNGINGRRATVNEPPDLWGKMHTAKLNLCVFNNSKWREKNRAVLFGIDENIYVSNRQLTFYGLGRRQPS